MSNSYKASFLQLILCCISNLLPHGHVVGNFEISLPYLKLIESQNCCFDNSKPYSAKGNMVSQLDTPFSALNCKSRFDFSDTLSLRCSMICLYVFSFLFLISNLILVIDSSSNVYSICWTEMRLDSSVVILLELLYSTSACSWKIGIANPPYLVGKDSNLRSSSLRVRRPVIAGMSHLEWCFQLVLRSYWYR